MRSNRLCRYRDSGEVLLARDLAGFKGMYVNCRDEM